MAVGAVTVARAKSTVRSAPGAGPRTCPREERALSLVARRLVAVVTAVGEEGVRAALVLEGGDEIPERR